MRLLLLGCTGFVGRALVPLLQERGHSLSLVSRQARPVQPWSAESVEWIGLDPSHPGSWQEERLRSALASAEGVVNLAGEPIAERRWTAAHCQVLRDSRLRTTELLVRAMAALDRPPQVLVSGSAIGFYGRSPDARFTEASPPGDDVLGRLCRDWEAAADAAPSATRVVKLRIGIVLGADGGALGRMLPVFRAGFGGPIGSGRQWMSWIERGDLCRLIAAALEDAGFVGVYNAVSPEPTRMATFAASLGRALGRPSLLPVPGPLLQLLLGDGAQVVLEGQQVVPERLGEQGFEFRHPSLSGALAVATSPGSR